MYSEYKLNSNKALGQYDLPTAIESDDNHKK